MDLDILVRNERAHPGPTCNYLASNRNNYGDIPFSELVALALRVTLPDLQRSQSVKGLAEIASEKQYAAKEGFLKAFFKYCKALKPQQQRVVGFTSYPRSSLDNAFRFRKSVGKPEAGHVVPGKCYGLDDHKISASRPRSTPPIWTSWARITLWKIHQREMGSPCYLLEKRPDN